MVISPISSSMRQMNFMRQMMEERAKVLFILFRMVFLKWVFRILPSSMMQLILSSTNWTLSEKLTPRMQAFWWDNSLTIVVWKPVLKVMPKIWSIESTHWWRKSLKADLKNLNDYKMSLFINLLFTRIILSLFSKYFIWIISKYWSIYLL